MVTTTINHSACNATINSSLQVWVEGNNGGDGGASTDPFEGGGDEKVSIEGGLAVQLDLGAKDGTNEIVNPNATVIPTIMEDSTTDWRGFRR